MKTIENDTSVNKVLGVFKKVGFVYPGRDSYRPDLNFCIKDQKLTVTGKIKLSSTPKGVVINFSKKKRYSKVYGLDESSDIEIFEDVSIFGYEYEIHIPRENITLIK
jgi:hypothetical protein